jgi:hypothetical protein
VAACTGNKPISNTVGTSQENLSLISNAPLFERLTEDERQQLEHSTVTPDLKDCAVKKAAVVVRVPGEFRDPASWGLLGE